ncbi:MAG: error-prone DNA polymerase [Pigmentiphaga sp.]
MLLPGGCMAGSAEHAPGGREHPARQGPALASVAASGVPGLPEYAELICTSNYSFLEGASHPEELVARAAELGYRALAITDECSVAGVVKAHEEALRQKLSLIIGSRFVLRQPNGEPDVTVVLLCLNRRGYGDLCELITLGRMRAPKGQYHLTRNDLLQPEGVSDEWGGLEDCLALWLPEAGTPPAALTGQAAWLARVFPGRAGCGLVRWQLEHEAAWQRRLQALGEQHGLPLVAAGDVRMHLRSRKPAHDLLRAIRFTTPVGECGHALLPNAEAHLRSRAQLARLYPPEALAATVQWAERCRFNLKELRYEYPDEIVPDGLTAIEYLRQEAWNGARRRYPAGIPEKIQTKLAYELDLVAELEYEAYFLTVYDLVREARRLGILCQGRGSAANSVICYCLEVTNADPNLTAALVERFISRERREPPDIDVDFEHDRREEVIQYLYRKYGRKRAALTAVVISYRLRSVLRDTGKALGLAPDVIETVARNQTWWERSDGLRERMMAAGLDAESGLLETWLHFVKTLQGFPRHLSQHPGGFVLSRGPLSRLVPIENATMSERSVVQWDKDDLDAVGLLKVDVLGLGMLSVLRRALELVERASGKPMALHQIPPDCRHTYDMICAADTMGTFQIESRAQMSMLPRLRPRRYYDLVVQVAIVRPGPVQGGMVHPYLRRRQGLERVELPTPKPNPALGRAGPSNTDLEPALGRTLGIPIFQEQVMQVAMIAAGFSAGRADSLRRAMAAWRRKGGLEPFHDELVAGMTERGYDAEFAEAIFRQIMGFGEYGFPESHAASFALLAYYSAWIKYHYPAAFLVALLNSQPMGFYRPAQLVQDARRHGVEVWPVDVCHSDWESRLALRAPGQRPAVRLGLNLVKGMDAGVARQLAAEREAGGPWRDVDDLVRRAGLEAFHRQRLAAAGALQSLAGHRRQAAWQAAAAEPDDLLAGLQSETPPRLAEPAEAQDIVADYRVLGLSLRRHPLAVLRPVLAPRGVRTAQELAATPHGRWVRACGLVLGRQRPGTAKGTVFVTLEDETGPINVIVWPALAARQPAELLRSRLMMVAGQWQAVDGVRHLVARRLFDWSTELGPLATRSRDFH